jgi:hydrogenase maturation protease
MSDEQPPLDPRSIGGTTPLPVPRAAEEDELRPPEKQILIAGIGNAWMRDDGFGGEVIRRLEQVELPSGVRALDFGTGGLDLAYEVMRGYDALVLVDVSHQDGPAGSLYVMEPEQESLAGQIEDGEIIDPHGMDPQNVLRFVNMIGAWPGRVVVVGCEPSDLEAAGFGLSDAVAAAVDPAVELVLSTVRELRTDAAYQA